MINILARSGFVVALAMICAVLVFAKISIDQASADSIVFVGDLTSDQLVSLRDELGDVSATLGEVEVVREKLEALSWVSDVSVRRQWPSTLLVEVNPEQVVAFWNDNGFINLDGEVLVTDLIIASDLPLLYGPSGTEAEVMSRYQQLGRMLATHGHEIRVLERSDRGSWSIETYSNQRKDRIKVLLGKEDLKARMDRFLDVSYELKRVGDDRSVSRMDARYVNGVAVQFGPGDTENNKLDLGSL